MSGLDSVKIYLNGSGELSFTGILHVNSAARVKKNKNYFLF